LHLVQGCWTWADTTTYICALVSADIPAGQVGCRRQGRGIPISCKRHMRGALPKTTGAGYPRPFRTESPLLLVADGSYCLIIRNLERILDGRIAPDGDKIDGLKSARDSGVRGSASSAFGHTIPFSSLFRTRRSANHIHKRQPVVLTHRT